MMDRKALGISTYLAISLLLTTIYIGRAGLAGHLNAPPEANDATDYHLIAVNLVRGDGFGVALEAGDIEAFGFTDPTAQLSALEPGLTAARQPVFPLLLTAIYKVFGYNYGLVRALNCLLMAGAATLAAGLAHRLAGRIALLAVIALAIVDPRMYEYATMMLTESLAAFETMLLAWMLLRLYDTGQWRWVGYSGVIVGAMILTRGIFLLWTPVLLGVVAAIIVHRKESPWRPCLAFTTTVIFVVAPWFIRNILVLQAFMPGGTQGLYDLAAAYSDAAWDNRGVWYPYDFAISPTGDRLETERLKAIAGRRIALEWIAAHPLKSAALPFMKLYNLWTAGGAKQIVFLLVVAIGVSRSYRSVEARILFAFFAANSLAVAATWTVYGRFLIPTLPALHIFVALAMVPLAAWLGRFRRRGEGDKV